MDEDLNEVVENLSTVDSGADLDELPVSEVTDDGAEVTVTVELPTGDTFSETFSKPPVWGTNCELKTLFDAYGLGPDDAHELEGQTVPCNREVSTGALSFSIDMEKIAEMADA